MSNSSLVNCTVKSPNHSGKRTHVIDRISPHCVVGQLKAKSIGGCFTSPSVQASCNYGIGTDGLVVLVVDESNRSWCTSSNENDQRAVTIECASDTTAPYAMTNTVYEKLVSLCVDICKRNGKTKLLWFGDKNKSLSYEPKSNEMVLTVHRWFANKSCPGDWLYSRLGDLANRVTSQLGGSTSDPSTSGTMYRVRKTWADAKSQVGAFTVLSNAKKKADETGLNVYDAAGNCVYSPSGSGSGGSSTFTVRVKISDLYIRKGPGTSYGTNGFCPIGVYTIIETKSANGYTWGRLKSGAGWIALEYAERL